jgi:hypothetical protein
MDTIENWSEEESKQLDEFLESLSHDQLLKELNRILSIGLAKQGKFYVNSVFTKQ